MSKSTKDAALDGCEAGFQDAIERLTAVHLGDWSMADSPAKQDQLAQRFRGTLEKYRLGYERVQQVINAVCT